MATVGYSLVSLGQETLSPRESNLFAVVLTLASIFLSAVLSTAYHHAGTSRATRDKDVQRANLIQSIKQQLDRLQEWNRQQLAVDVVSEERFRHHCDHLNETLEGIDCQFDAMLKEIGGNIGDADRQAVALLENVKKIGNEIQSLESERQRIEAQSDVAETPQDYDELQRRLAEITAQQENLVATITKLTATNSSERASSVDDTALFVALSCPYCDTGNRLIMAGFAGETRMHKCRACQRYFNAHCTAPGYFITRETGESKNPFLVSREHFLNLRQDTSRQDTFSLRQDTLSPPGFDFSPEEFKLISDILIAIYSPGQYTLRTLNDNIYAGLEGRGIGKSRIGKFVQLLYWARLFQLEAEEDGDANSRVLITNGEISRHDLASRFFRSVGYRMAELIEPGRDEVRADIARFLQTAAADLDPDEMVHAYFDGRESALGGLRDD